MSNPLLYVGERFHQKYKLTDGRSYYGQVLQPPDTSRVSNFLSARRYLRTKPDSIIQARHVTIIDRKKFIIAEHGTGFYIDPIYEHWKLFEVDEEYTWVKHTKTTDAVTGVEIVTRTTQQGTVPLSIQPHASLKDSMQVPQECIVAVTSAELKIDDLVGDYLVIKEDVVLGITLVQLKKVDGS